MLRNEIINSVCKTITPCRTDEMYLSNNEHVYDVKSVNTHGDSVCKNLNLPNVSGCCILEYFRVQGFISWFFFSSFRLFSRMEITLKAKFSWKVTGVGSKLEISVF